MAGETFGVLVGQGESLRRLMRQQERNRSWRRCLLLYTAFLVFGQLSAFPLSKHPHSACPLLELARVHVRAACFGLRCTSHISALMARFGLSASRAPAPSTSSSKKPRGRPRKSGSSSAIPGPGPTCDVKTTPALQNLLDSWGRELKDKVMACYDAWTTSGEVYPEVGASGCALKAGVGLNVGTDCSGAEAPIWALKAMGIKHKHKFSCDWKKPVRDFIAAVSPPEGPIFDNMLKRKRADIPDVDLYVCGFPCTPYSSLRRHKTRLLQEVAAKPFTELLKVLEERKPALAVLENVVGIEAVLQKVCQRLGKLGCYLVIVVKIDSEALGVPLKRPRYYFILVRKDVSISKNVLALASLCKAIRKGCTEPVRGTVLDLLLPSQRTPATPQRTRAKQSTVGKAVDPKYARRKDVRCKWKAKHAAFRKKFALSPPTSFEDSDALGLQNPRQREMWQLLVNTHRGKKIIADVSQNIDRCRVSTNCVCPTVTPHSTLCIQAVSRALSPMDTLAMHFFPVHRMKIPTAVKAETLRSLGGNTMHLKSVGLAMCMGLAMVKPSFGVESRGVERNWAAEGAPGIGNVCLLDKPKCNAKRKVPQGRRAAGPRPPAKRRRVGPARQPWQY